MSLFITGTDTGVGKTTTAAQLLRLLRASGVRCAGMKPICCGDRRDAEFLLAAGSEGLTIEEINPVWLKAPVAPLVGSLMEGWDIDIERILTAFRALRNRVEHVIVEGVGGWFISADDRVVRVEREGGPEKRLRVAVDLGDLDRAAVRQREVAGPNDVLHRGLR